MMSLKHFARAYWKYILLAVVVVGVGGYFFFGSSQSLGATMTIAPADFPTQVAVSGTVKAAENVALGFAASGRVSGVYAAVGAHVSAGDLLATVENGDIAAGVAGKQAAVAEAQANLDSLLAGTRPEQLAVASTSVASAQSALVNALQSAYTASDAAVHNTVDAFFTNPRVAPKLAFTVSNATLKTTVENDRSTVETVLSNWALANANLSNANVDASAPTGQTALTQVIALLADANSALNQAVPDQTTSSATLAGYATALATARANVNGAASTVTADQSALASAEKNFALLQAGATANDIAAARAAVAAAEADVANTQAALAKTQVRAPFSGTVTQMDAKVGEVISPSDSQISLQSDGVFEIETYVPEVSIAGVLPGDSASTTLDAYGTSVIFPTKVVSVDPAETVKDGVPTYKTTLTFLSADPRIRSGMTANVAITTSTLRDAIVIPAAAVGMKNGQPYVSILAGGKVMARTVSTGVSPSLGETEITNGLSAGDVILLAPTP